MSGGRAHGGAMDAKFPNRRVPIAKQSIEFRRAYRRRLAQRRLQVVMTEEEAKEVQRRAKAAGCQVSPWLAQVIRSVFTGEWAERLDLDVALSRAQTAEAERDVFRTQAAKLTLELDEVRRLLGQKEQELAFLREPMHVRSGETGGDAAGTPGDEGWSR